MLSLSKHESIEIPRTFADTASESPTGSRTYGRDHPTDRRGRRDNQRLPRQAEGRSQGRGRRRAGDLRRQRPYPVRRRRLRRSEGNTSELQLLKRISYTVFCWTQKQSANKYN